MKPLVILQTYNRPTMVIDALEGIKNQTYKDFYTVVVDDGSDFDIVEKVKSVLTEPTPLYRAVALPKMDLKDRIYNNRQGWVLNGIVSGTDADFFIVHADDDVMHSEYIEKTRQYFMDNPDVMYAYGPLRYFDRSKGEVPNDNAPLRSDQGPVSAPGKVDMAQVAFRVKPFKDNKALMFPEGKFWNLDEMIFRQLEAVYGLCQYFPHMTMYKSIGDHTMTHGLHGSNIPTEQWIERRE